MELTPKLTKHILEAAEAWAINNPVFGVTEATAHISRAAYGAVQKEENGFRVCIDIPGQALVFNVVVQVTKDKTIVQDVKDRIDIANTTIAARGCMACFNGQLHGLREDIPED